MIAVCAPSSPLPYHVQMKPSDAESRTFSDRDGAEVSDATSLSARLRERIIALQHALDRTAAALGSKATPKGPERDCCPHGAVSVFHQAQGT
jgi:hypothetical protein